MKTKASEKLIETSADLAKLVAEWSAIYDRLLLRDDLSVRTPATLQQLQALRRRAQVLSELIDVEMSMMVRFLSAADSIKLHCSRGLSAPLSHSAPAPATPAVSVSCHLENQGQA
jgi:hypothetical protein